MELAVIGAGAWGTALSKILSEKGHSVVLWAREDEVVSSIRDEGVNRRFLPGVELPPPLRATGELAEAVDEAEAIVFAVPSRFFRTILESTAPHIDSAPVLVSATKGIEEGSLLRMSEVVAEVWPDAEGVVALSGPTFAPEVARGEPTALVAASASPPSAERIQTSFSTPSFRIYTNDDVVGVELGGAVKNVIALAVGVAKGLGLGYNPIAALMTRGLAEMSRLSEAMGGRRETLAGLAGMGDLVLTCTGELSRNRRVGIALGQGRKLDEILGSMDQVAEGVPTAHAAVALAERHGVEMPIAVQVNRLLKAETTSQEVMRDLMSRPLKAE